MKLWTIIKREYKQIVKKKSFLISTILTPIMMAGFMYLPLLLTKVGKNEKSIEIADYSGFIKEKFLEYSRKVMETSDALKLEFKAPTLEVEEQYRLIEKYEQSQGEKIPASLELTPGIRQRILDKKIDGFLIIPGNIRETRRVYFCALNISDFDTNKYITSTVQKILSEKILIEKNIELTIVEDAIRDIAMRTFKVKKEGTSRVSSGIEYAVSIFMLSILFSIIMGYGQLLMRGVLEEKNSRIVELLISSTDSSTLFYGKIIGIGLAGLTQVALWIILVGFFLGQGVIGIEKSVAGFFTPELGFYFVIYFILGYFMYSVMFSAIGASVNTDQEAQQYSAPVIYLLLIPFFVGFMVTQNPNSPIVVWGSLIPLFTPTLMFMRISVALPPLIQIVVSIILSILCIFFLAWLGARIFRVGILMYGKKPSFKEILRWARYH